MPSERSHNGPRIVPSADYGNSPKNTLLQDITNAKGERVKTLRSYVIARNGG